MAFDEAGRIVDVCGTAERILGRSREELIGRCVFQLQPSTGAPPAVPAASEPAAECRLASTRQLVAGIAHEISQPLSAIVNFSRACANVLDKGTVDWSVLRDWNGEMGTAAQRATEIVARLRRLLGAPGRERQSVDVKDLVAESIALAAIDQRTCPVDLRQHPGAETATVCVNRAQLQQVLVYLLHGAREAIEGRGAEGRQLVVATSVIGSRVQVVVSTRGPGVPANGLTAETCAAQELGGVNGSLAISQMIVEAHGGSLSNARRGRAAEFLLSLPRSDSHAH